jgi:hypothetical protein
LQQTTGFVAEPNALGKPFKNQGMARIGSIHVAFCNTMRVFSRLFSPPNLQGKSLICVHTGRMARLLD